MPDLTSVAMPSPTYLPGVDAPRPGIFWEFQVMCPRCGDDAVDRGDGEIVADHQAVTVHPDRDEYKSPLGTRGGYAEIRLFCTAGHRFALIIANHKGAEYVGAVALESSS